MIESQLPLESEGLDNLKDKPYDAYKLEEYQKIPPP